MEKIKILKDIGLLGTWFYLSKLINLFTFFVIAKFLSPTDFGLLNLTLGILFFFMIFPQSISEAIMKFISEKGEKSIFVKGLKWSILSGILLSILIYILSDLISQFFSQQISQYIKLISILFFITSIYEVFKGTFLGLKKVNYFVITETILCSSNFLIIIFFSWRGFNIYSPLFSLLIAYILSLLISLLLMRKINFDTVEFDENKNAKILSFANKSMIITISTHLILFSFVYFITNYRPVEELGYYYFLSKITIFILSIFPLTLNRVLLPYFSEYYFRKDLAKFQKLSDAYLKLIFYSSLTLGISTYFIFSSIIPLFFSEYFAAKNYLLLFCILGVVLSSGTFPSTLLSATNKLRTLIASQLFIFIFSTLLSYFFIPNYGLNAVSIIYVSLYVLTLILTMFFIKYKIKINYSLLINKQDIKITTNLFGRN